VSFADPAGWWLLLAAIPILLLHMLRPRRPAVEVSSTFLWQEVARPVSSAVPWQRLRPSVLLLLQLLAVVLLAAAVARPVRPTPAPLSQHTVFIIDTAGSMAAIDGKPDRIGAAKAKALSLRAQLPAGGVASIVVASPQPQVVLSASPDADAFRAALDAIQVEAATPDYATAFSLAEGLETPGQPVGFVFVSDGELTSSEAGQLPPGTHYVEVGSRDTNRAITALEVDPTASGLHATVTVRNTGGPAATQTLRLDVDNRTVSTMTLHLAPGATVTKGVNLPNGDHVVAYLEGEDLLGIDNQAYAVAARRRPLKVLFAGAPDPYVQSFLAASPGVTVTDKATSVPAPGYDLAVYDQVAVPADPQAPVLAIDPPGGMAGVAVTGAVPQPVVTLVDGSDQLLNGLDLSSVAIAQAQRISAPTDQVLVGAPGTPLLLRGEVAGQPFAYLGFALSNSNLGVQVAWPILADRLLSALTGAAVPPSDLVVGDPLPLGTAHPALSITGPDGIALQLGPDDPAPDANRPGFWTVHQAGRPDDVFAVNADPRQSDLTPAASLPIKTRPPVPGEKQPGGQSSLLGWVVAALIVVLAIELFLEWRARASSAGQWRAALVLRAALVAALVAALLGITLPRTEKRLAVVFVLDQSDSMGAGGRLEAAQWVQQALSQQPKNDLAGVVVFGADAKVDLTVQHNTQLLASEATVDTTQTNLAQALRLAAALLPTDARRRVIVVSDGRANVGDADAEAAVLRGEGVRVDEHPVTAAAGPDVAVTGLQAPTLVRDGEAFQLQATINSNETTTVGLTLSRDGAVVDQQTVNVTPGDTVVPLAQSVAPGQPAGVLRYQLQISAAYDSVPQNDVGYASVPVEGPAQVLLVEGVPGEAATLGRALAAGGLETTTVSPADLPPIDQLASYQSTVLVDIDQNMLSPDQVSELKVDSEDLGKGLVVLGGDRSYGLGGYYSSDLEQLLPVVSNVTDPKRQLSVAEVLAIDSSGSMAACHCNDGANGMVDGGNRVNGGVNKTDISRAGAARAIAALNANDEVGVLAFNTEQKWIVPLQTLPPESVVTKGLNSLTPAGGTDLTQPLPVAGAALRATHTQLKHIILFTDGFTSSDALSGLVQQAGQLYQEGITVSVLATGEASTAQLAEVAAAGHGRFYADSDLSQVPTIMAQEAVLATRDLVVEGSFYPKVVSSSPVVSGLTSSPPLLGYLATTAKATASTLLSVGTDNDPLLVSWQPGLGKVTSWTSDASARWSQAWANWPGYVAFWSGVVKDSFPLQGAAGSAVQAQTAGGVLRVTVTSQQPWPNGSSATARIADPALDQQTITLQQTSSTSFVGQIPATAAGTYAVGATVTGPSGRLLSATAVATQSYSAEYLPGQPDPVALARVSRLSGGRGAISPSQAFQASGLPAGKGLVPLTAWFLLAAALLWPVVVALGRLALNGAAASAWERARGLRRSFRHWGTVVTRRAGGPLGPGAGGSGPRAGGRWTRAGAAGSRAESGIGSGDLAATSATDPAAPSAGDGAATEHTPDEAAVPATTVGKLLQNKRSNRRS
jgi:Mg-chelatase subunit ChlD